jgi:hypothetical protein
LEADRLARLVALAIWNAKYINYLSFCSSIL